MPVEADTHGMVATGAGSTAANAETVVGTITLPAGGDWKIFQIWCQAVRATATAGESMGGNFRLNAPAGDLKPHPAPSRFPTGMGGSFLGATEAVQINQLNLIDVEYTAPGKSTIELIYNEASAVTVASQVAMGIIFGKTRPVMKPFTFSDRVRGTVTAAAAATIGTITMAENAKKITGLCMVPAQDGVLTAAEELLGFFSLSSDDVKLPPAQFPMSAAFGGGLGVTIGNHVFVQPVWVPVNIPVEGGARIDVSVDLNTAVTNAAEFDFFLAYE